jgi:hypothetical protein
MSETDAVSSGQTVVSKKMKYHSDERKLSEELSLVLNILEDDKGQEISILFVKLRGAPAVKYGDIRIKASDDTNSKITLTRSNGESDETRLSGGGNATNTIWAAYYRPDVSEHRKLANVEVRLGEHTEAFAIPRN